MTRKDWGVSELKRELEKAFVEMYVLDVDIEDKSLEVEEKLHAAAKLAKASGKSLSGRGNRKSWWLGKVRFRGSASARPSLNIEQEAHDATICKHREELCDWHKKLQDFDERLCKCQRFIFGERKR